MRTPGQMGRVGARIVCFGTGPETHAGLWGGAESTAVSGLKQAREEERKLMVTQSVAERMPGSVKAVMVGVWFQAVFNGLGGLLLLSLMNDRFDHGQEVADLGLVRFSVYASLFASVGLLLSGVFAWKRFGWVRVTVLVIECAIVLVSMVNVFVEGVPSAGIGLVIAVLMGRTMLGEPARHWFDR
jgi:hypothetical protein